MAITFGIPHISASGHFGGGIAGLVIAVPLEYVRYGRGWQRLASALGLLTVPLVGLGMIQFSITVQERMQANFIRLSRLMLEIRENCDAVYENHAKPFLEKEARDMFTDQDAVNRTLTESTTVRQRLKSAQSQLAGHSFPESKERTLESAKEYIAAWSAYFDLLQTILTRGTAPTDEETNTFHNRLRKTQSLTRRLFD